MKLVKLKCDNCGAKLEVDVEQDKIYCKYCRAEILIDDKATELRRIEDVKLQARKQNHEQTIKEKKELEELNAVDNFKKGKFSKVLLVFAAICGLLTFTREFDFASIIALIQTALFIAAWLFGMEIIKQPNKKLYIILALIGFGLIIPFMALINKTETYDYGTKCETINWNELYLKDKVVSIYKQKGEILNNSKEGLYFKLCEIDRQTYDKYINEITNKGYTIDTEDETNTYLAYNEEGYRIYLHWYDNELTVDLDSPVKMSEITWPTTGPALKIPKPNSTLGNITWDNDERFSTYIGNITKQDYENYIIACQDAGFTNNHSKTDKRYSATNNDNYKIVLEYHGFNIMYISIDAENAKNKQEDNKKETTKNEMKEKTQTNNTTTNDNEIRTNFKEAMDSYEKFIDEYIAFMKKYSANNSDLSLLKDYSNYLSKYSEMVSKFDKWNSEDLNTAETKYYIEVQTRVNKKLTDAALDN